jgi:hypothetical protein
MHAICPISMSSLCSQDRDSQYNYQFNMLLRFHWETTQYINIICYFFCLRNIHTLYEYNICSCFLLKRPCIAIYIGHGNGKTFRSIRPCMQDQVFKFCHCTSVKVHVIVYNLLKIYCINSNMQKRAILSKTIVSRPCYYMLPWRTQFQLIDMVVDS